MQYAHCSPGHRAGKGRQRAPVQFEGCEIQRPHGHHGPLSYSNLSIPTLHILQLPLRVKKFLRKLLFPPVFVRLSVPQKRVLQNFWSTLFSNPASCKWRPHLICALYFEFISYLHCAFIFQLAARHSWCRREEPSEGTCYLKNTPKSLLSARPFSLPCHLPGFPERSHCLDYFKSVEHFQFSKPNKNLAHRWFMYM